MRRPSHIARAIVAALVAASALGIATAAFLAFFVRSAQLAEPSDKARVLGQTISEAMNCVAMFPVFTVPVAVFLAWKKADLKTTVRVSLAAFAGLLVAFGVTAAWARIYGHAPAGASDAQRASVSANAFAEALYNGALLALLTVPGACAIAWRARGRPRE
jgi:hypothetical protein